MGVAANGDTKRSCKAKIGQLQLPFLRHRNRSSIKWIRSGNHLRITSDIEHWFTGTLGTLATWRRTLLVKSRGGPLFLPTEPSQRHKNSSAHPFTLLISRFWGLRSRCSTRCSWMKAIPRRSWNINDCPGGGGIGTAALDMTRQPSRTLHQPHAMQTLHSGARACHGGAAVCVRACV